MNGVPKTKSFLIALIIFIGLVFLNVPTVSNQIKDFFYSISGPIQGKFDYFVGQIKDRWEFLKDLKEVSKKNIELEEEIQKLTAENTQLKEIEKENQFLRSSLGLSGHRKYQLELADVVSRDFQGVEKYILINKGRLAGIKNNMPVIVFKNILVGKIIETLDDFSKVLLITSPNSKIPALIQDSRVGGLIRGIASGLLSFDLIPKDVEVEKGQIVVTSGIGGIFPKGILIGKILSIESKDDAIFQKIEVAPAAELENLERVFIIKSY